MCNLFLLFEGLDGLPSSVASELDKATRYLAQTPTRLEDETTYLRSHDLQFYRTQGKKIRESQEFSIPAVLVKAAKQERKDSNQTWMLA